MSFRDTDTGLEVCKKHNWEQIKDCIYCERDHLLARNAELEAEVTRLRKAHAAMLDLINSSQGVYGLHLNGDGAPWDSLRTGGQFEAWLLDFDAALEANNG